MEYSIFKSLHLISLICWFAALFYLPRLFVYHVNADKKSSEMLKKMEFRLYRYIMSPSMTLTWVFGGYLLYLNPYFLSNGWLHIKLLLVIILTGYTHICGSYLKKFKNDENIKSEKYFRIFNEVPTILLILIVFLVIIKPF